MTRNNRQGVRNGNKSGGRGGRGVCGKGRRRDGSGPNCVPVKNTNRS